MKAGVRDIKKIVAVLEAGHQTVEEAAVAALEAAWELYETKAKYVVVGQLFYSLEDGYATSKEVVEASRMALGVYGTELQAQQAAKSLRWSNRSGQQYQTWYVPLMFMTPAKYHELQQAQHKEEEVVNTYDWLPVINNRYSPNPDLLPAKEENAA